MSKRVILTVGLLRPRTSGVALAQPRGEMSPDLQRNDSPDDQLVGRARAGDRQAFDELVTRYQDYVYRLMVRACHHPQDAEEVAMDAFARAYQRLAQFEGRSTFISWLGKIATNLCLRRRAAVVPQLVPFAPTGGGAEGRIESAEPTPEQQAMRSELKCKIQAALDELPEPDRSVLRLRDIEQWSAKEVAGQMGLTVPAVKARLHRARGLLRERLNLYLLDGEEAPAAGASPLRREGCEKAA